MSLSMLSPFSSTSESGDLLQSPDRESETPNSTPILSQAERKSKRVSSLGSMAMAMGFKSKPPPSSSSSSSTISNLKSKNSKKPEASGNKALDAAAAILGLTKQGPVKSSSQPFEQAVNSSTSLLFSNNDPTNSRRASIAIVSGDPLYPCIEAPPADEDGTSTEQRQHHHKPRLTVQPLLLKPAMQSCLKNAYRLSLPNGLDGGTSLVDHSQLAGGVLPYPTPSIIFPSQTTLLNVSNGLTSSASTMEVDPSIAHLDFRNHSQTIMELDEQRRASDPDVKSAFEKELFEWLDTEGKGKGKQRSRKGTSIGEDLVGNSSSGQWNSSNGGEDGGDESGWESQGYRADVDDFDSPCLGSEQYKSGSRIHTHATRSHVSRKPSGREREIRFGLEGVQESIPKALKAPRFKGTVTEIVSQSASTQEEELEELQSDHQPQQIEPQSSNATLPLPPRPLKSRARGTTLGATGAAAEFDYSFQSKNSSKSSRKQKFSDPFASLDPFPSSTNGSPVPGSPNLSRARATSSPSLLQPSAFGSSHEPLCTNNNLDGGSCCPAGTNHHGQVGRLHTRRPAGLHLSSLPKASLWAPVEIKANGGALAGRNMRAPPVIDPRKSESDGSQSEGTSNVRKASREEKGMSNSGVGIGLGLGLGLGLRANYDPRDRSISATEPLRPPRRISAFKPNVDSRLPSTLQPEMRSSRSRTVSAAPPVPEVQNEEAPSTEIGLGFSPSTLLRARSVTLGAFAKPKAKARELSPRPDDEHYLERSEREENLGISASLLGLSFPLKGLNAPTNKHTSLPARFIAPEIPAAPSTPFLDLDASQMDETRKSAMSAWVEETIKATRALGSLGQGKKVVEAPATGKSGISTSLFSPAPLNKHQTPLVMAQQSGMMRWDLEGTSTSVSSKDESSSSRLIPVKLVKPFRSPSEHSVDEKSSLLVPAKSPEKLRVSPSPSYQLALPSCAITVNSGTSEESSSAPLFGNRSSQRQAEMSKVPITDRERRNASSVQIGSSHGNEAAWFKGTPSPIMSASKFKSYSSNSQKPNNSKASSGTVELAQSLGFSLSPEAQKKVTKSPQLAFGSPRLGSPHPLRNASKFGSDSEEEELLLEGENVRPGLGRTASHSSSVSLESSDSRGGLLFIPKSNSNSGSPMMNRGNGQSRSKTQRRPLTAPSCSPSASTSKRVHPSDYPPLLSRRDSCSSVGSVKMVREGSTDSFGSFLGGRNEISSPSPSENLKPFQSQTNRNPSMSKRNLSPLISYPSPLAMSRTFSRDCSPRTREVLKEKKFDSPLLINLASPVVEEVKEQRREKLGLRLTRSVALHIDTSASTVSSEELQENFEASLSSASSSSGSSSSQVSPTSSRSAQKEKSEGSSKSNKKLSIDLEDSKMFLSAFSRAKIQTRVATPFFKSAQLGDGFEEEEALVGKFQINASSATPMTSFSEEGAGSILSGTTAC